MTDCKREIEAQIYLVNDFKEDLLKLKFYDSYKVYLEEGEQLKSFFLRNPFSTYDPRTDMINHWTNMYVAVGGPPYSIVLPQGISLEECGGTYLGKFTSKDIWKILKIDESSFFTWNSVKKISHHDKEADITTLSYLDDVTAYTHIIGGLWALDVTLLEKIDKKFGFGKVSRRDRLRGFLETNYGEKKLITTQIYVLNANVVLDVTSSNIASLTNTYSSKNLQSHEEVIKKIANNE
ncbi:DgyrCDS12476 [Dimorphilus gyrociliatus]|nr:DgyrCDS12476 [Dimorphilus gyrociliatus]